MSAAREEEARGRVERLQRRAQALHAVRAFFDARGFIEVETPSMVPSPGLDAHLDAFELSNTEAPRWLITSPEYQMKRLLAEGCSRIYQICRCFRRGELGPLHQPEFTMVEWYRTDADSDAIMRDTEELVAYVADQLSGRPTLYGAVQFGATETTPRVVDAHPPWDRITVERAFHEYAQVPLDGLLNNEEQFFRLWVEKIEPQLGRDRPVFVTRWPASMASLARLCPDDPTVADRTEAFVAGIELSNGFGELVDPIEQRARLERDQERRRSEGRPVYPIDERFLAALESGIPPCAGNALGLDRLLMLLFGAPTIDDVVAFPHHRL